MQSTLFIKTLRITALLEGISFLILLLIAMPLKYVWDFPAAVRFVGMAHGILFVAYIYVVLAAWQKFNMNARAVLISLAGGFLPLGTFYADYCYFKNLG